MPVTTENSNLLQKARTRYSSTSVFKACGLLALRERIEAIHTRVIGSL
mgnify:CR=1 FL=1